MLDDVDATLGAFFTAMVPSHPAVQFEPPTIPPTTKARKATLHLALLRLHEEIEGVAADWEDRRDNEGRVISRERAPRKFRVLYLVDAEADTVNARHALIGAALRAMIDYDEVPGEYRKGDLAKDLPMLLRPADVPERRDAILALEVVVAVRPTPSTDIAPPATELELTAARIDVPAGFAPSPLPSAGAGSEAGAVGPGDRKWTTYRVRETATTRDE